MPKNSFKYFFFCLLLAGSLLPARAAHIAGGDLTYRRLNGNNFEVTLKFFRDCTNFTEFDSTVIIGVFDKVTNARVAIHEFAIADTGLLTLTGSSCLRKPDGVCMDKCVYIDTISLPNNPNGYYISWERCCRNAALVNLTQPGRTGIAYYIEIPDPALINNSPYFNTDPLPFMCVGQDFVFDFSAIDTDGDQLVYSLETPLAGDLGYPNTSTAYATWGNNPTPAPYPSVQWLPPYSLSNITGSSVPLTLNSSTGIMNIKADNIGYYSLAVVVKEYRGGVLIGLIRREIEFTVISCPINTAPQITYENTTVSNDSLTFTLFETDTLCFTIRVQDTDSMKLTYNGDIFPGGSASPPYAVTSNANGAGSITSSFCWYTSCGQGRNAPYKVNYIALDNGCPQPFTTTDSLKIFLQPMPLVPPAILICMDIDTAGTVLVNYADTFSYKRFFSRYDVYRCTGNNPFSLYKTITNLSANKFFDANATSPDTIDYCYFFVGYNKCGDIGFHSDTLCSLSQLTVNPVPLISSVVSEDTVFINLIPSADNPYSVFYVKKKDNTNGAMYGTYQTLNGIENPYFTDVYQNTKEESYCYTVIKENQCGKLSPVSNEACSILLTGESLPGQNVLNWTAYTYWVNDVSRYAIYRKREDETNFTLLSKVPKENLTYFDDQFPGDYGIYNYLIKAEDDSTVNESISNIVTLKQEAVVFAPDAFTPNGDGKNETWLPISQFVRAFDLSVFNRWGNIVFQSSSKSLPWNGTYNDLPVNQGVYFYKLVFTSYIDNKQQIKTGKVTVIR